MILHYLKIAFRNMWKYKTQSFTGIFGLAFGLACFVPALFWLRYETSYDSFYPDATHIYRIYSVEKQSGKVNEQVPGILKRKLQEHFPATETSSIFYIEPDNYSTEETPHIRLRTLYADSSFFRVFPQDVVSGDARQPLQTVHNIVLTETVAIRLFGDVEKAIGQQIKSKVFFFLPPYTVTAVVKGTPPNTNSSFDAILFSDMLDLSSDTFEAELWTYFNTQMYVKLHPRTDVDKLAEQLRDFTSQLGTNANIELQMLPVSDVRHRLNTDAPFTLNFIRLFVAAGILLLFSALFNFLNLHLDLFHQRIRELRQRTVHGAKSGQLVLQMMFELACSILPALALACCFIVLTRPLFSGLLGMVIGMSPLIHLFVTCGICVITLMLLIGFIPFWRLSHIAMRHFSKRKVTGGQPVLRRMAVTLQLAVSIVFIVAALVVMMQMRFVGHKDLGFDRSGIIQLSNLPAIMPKSVRTALIHELEAIPQIKNISATYFEPHYSADSHAEIAKVEWPEKAPYEKPDFHFIATDSRFAETFNLKMLAGKWFNESGEYKIVLNEEAVRVMGLSEPTGTVIRLSTTVSGDMEEYEVVGVVNNFHTMSLRSRILPTIFIQSSSLSRSHVFDNILYISVVNGQEREAIRRITAILPGLDASYADIHLTTLDELYDRFNKSEQAGLKMFSVLATVCLLISLFGIYAVASTATHRRRKEIAIRKVVGAEVRDIVRLFFREYTRQVIIAGIISLPLAYFAMSRWLQGYAYRTNIPWWLLTGVITVIVAVVLLTVLGQVLKAANSNPAEVIKSE